MEKKSSKKLKIPKQQIQTTDLQQTEVNHRINKISNYLFFFGKII